MPVFKPGKTLTPDNITGFSIRELRNSIQFGQTNCLDIARVCLENRLRHDPLLQAFHQTNDENFRLHAEKADLLWRQGNQGFLTGIPCSLKSMYAADGLLCHAGTISPMPDKLQKPGTIVRRLHDNFSPVSGLTHASELAFSGLGINPHWGTPKNPWDSVKHRVPGGSSSGAAISVISGAAVFALGTDTGGSVRVPAAASGMVGLKTGTGRWPTDGIVPLSPRFDTVGIITHTVSDALDVFLALDGKNSVLHQVPDTTFADYQVCLADDGAIKTLSPSLLRIFESTLKELEEAGLKITPSEIDVFNQTNTLADEGPNTAAIECSAFIESNIPELRNQLGRQTDRLITTAESISAKRYLLRIEKLAELKNYAQKAMQDIDILISPTLGTETPDIESINSDTAYAIASTEMLRNTVVANLCGFCAITLPNGLDSNGMPTGIQLMAKNGEELKLLEFAALIERCLGTSASRLGKAPLLQ